MTFTAMSSYFEKLMPVPTTWALKYFSSSSVSFLLSVGSRPSRAPHAVEGVIEVGTTASLGGVGADTGAAGLLGIYDSYRDSDGPLSSTTTDIVTPITAYPSIDLAPLRASAFSYQISAVDYPA